MPEHLFLFKDLKYLATISATTTEPMRWKRKICQFSSSLMSNKEKCATEAPS